MKSTRRGWLTALSSLIALPLLPKSSTTIATRTPESPDLVELLTRQPFTKDRSTRPIPWDEAIRTPLSLDEIRCREESRHDDIHFLRTVGAPAKVILPHQQELQHLSMARRLLAHLRSGEPLTVRYAGGHSPGKSRTVLPTLVFHTDTPRTTDTVLLVDPICPGSYQPPHLYLQAYCLERLASRNFRLDRIESLHTLTRENTAAA